MTIPDDVLERCAAVYFENWLGKPWDNAHEFERRRVMKNTRLILEEYEAWKKEQEKRMTKAFLQDYEAWKKEQGK